MTAKVQSAQMPRTVGITRLLEEVRKGDLEAEEQRLSRVYHAPRALAASMMAHAALGHTLQPAALVDGTWVRVFGHAKPHCPDRAYSFAAVGEVLRRTQVANARRSKRIKQMGRP